MNFEFIQGFSPVLPVLVILLLAIVSLFLSWWSYQYISSIANYKRYALISLRAITLFILLFLLLNPFFVRQQVNDDKPRVAVFVDNSQSLSVERGEYGGIDSYSALIQQFRSSESSDFDYEYFFFDDEIYSFDEITLDGFRTNLNTLLEYIRERETDYNASVIFSDGIITNGRNPVYAAQNLSIPLITVPVGDTSDVRDIALTDVDFIQTVYTQTQQTITAEIQQQGFEGEQTTVQLFQDGTLTETGSLSFTTETSSQTVEFDLEFTDPGFFDYEIRVPVKDEEFTGQNNRSQFTIEVLEDKTNILSLAFEVHPDVGSIRKIIATDQQNELLSSTYLGDNRFSGLNPQEIDESLDLIVLHGLPETNSSIFEWLYDQQTPVLFIATPGSFQILQSRTSMGVTAFYMSSVVRNSVNIRMQPFQSSITHPVLELQSAGMERFPQLQIYQGEFQLSPLAETLITGRYRNFDTDIPILITEDASTNRRASLAAYGWYRFEQTQVSEARDFFEQLITNLVSWTSTSPDRENLVIEPTKSVFSENEAVELNATLFNERGEPEPSAIIELEINYEDSDKESSVFRMAHRQNESYTAEIGNYPQGIYRVEATATKNNRTIGTAETRVRVSQSSAEFLNTKRDDPRLSQLADFTEGLFLQNHNFSRLNEFLLNSERVENNGEVTEEVEFIYHSVIWFFVVILLLSAEWILRRSVSLP